MSVLLVPLPLSWLGWARRLRCDLGLQPGESARIGRVTAEIALPAVLHDDYQAMAVRVGWTYDQLLSYLVVQGALRLAEQSQARVANRRGA